MQELILCLVFRLHPEIFCSPVWTTNTSFCHFTVLSLYGFVTLRPLNTFSEAATFLSLHTSQTKYCALSTVHYLLSTIYCPLSTVHYPLSNICCSLSTVNSLLSTIFCPLSTVNFMMSTI